MNDRHRRTKIAFLTTLNTRDRHVRKASWSGTYYYMAKALQKYCGDVYHLGPVESRIEAGAKIYNRIAQIFTGKRYSSRHSILLSMRYARIFHQKIAEGSYDIIFAPAAAIEAAFLNTKTPIVYSSDTTFRLLLNYYPEYSNLLGRSIREGNVIEKLAIQKASVLLYPTEWAAQSACNDYHADRAKIRIVPYGTNLEEIPMKENVLQRKKSNRCRLLFLGVDWKRKGGEIAFDALLRLEEFGVQAELVVCGCVPPRGFAHERMQVIPFLDKNDEKQHKELQKLFLTSDFFLLPTRSECYGMVFCEANAYGLPVITTDTGGVSGVIQNGENGFLLPTKAAGIEYARIISKLYHDNERYDRLVQSSRRIFDDRLNWDSWGLKVREIIADLR